MMEIKSGDTCKCGWCGYQGVVYGALTGKGGTAPWCSSCCRNDWLKPVEKEEANED